jgi:hypothetical protein
MRRTLRRSVRTAQSPRTYFWKVFSESEVSALDRTDRWEARARSTGHRQNRRILRSRVPTAEGSAVSASHAATARRVSSSSTGCQPRSVSRRASD